MSQFTGDRFQERESLLEIGTNFIGGSSLISPDGRLLAVLSPEHVIEVWDLSRRALLRRISTGEARLPRPYGFLADGTSLVTVDRENGAPSVTRKWDLTTGQMKQLGGRGESSGDSFAAAFSPDERWFLYLAQSGLSHRIDMTSGREEEAPGINLRQAAGAAFSPDGSLFAAVSQMGMARLWEVASMRPVDTLRGFLQGTHSLGWSPDGKRLAIGSDGDEAIKLWDVESRQELVTLAGEGNLFWSTAFSPDGDVLGSVSNQGILHLWRAPSWEEIAAAKK